MIQLVVLLLLITLLAAFWLTIKNVRKATQEHTADELSPEARTIFRKLQRLYNELEETAKRNKDTASPFVAQEALTEGSKLLKHSSEALLLRDRLKKELWGRYDAQKGIEDLQGRLSTAASDEEKTNLERTLSARNQELEQYGTLESTVAKIDSSIQQAEALLSEMKARVASSAASGAAEESVEGLREAVGRMRSLNASVDEIEQLTNG
jgi:hypothetical protein